MERLTLNREVAGIPYRVKELTVEEIRLWLLRMERAYAEPQPQRSGLCRRVLVLLGIIEPIPAPVQDVVDLMLFDDLSMFDVSTLTTLTREQIGTLTPAQVREVWQECRGVNADFFQMRRRLEQIGKVSQQAPGAISNVLSPA